MNGVKFGDYHSYDDLFLFLVRKEIGSPVAKTKLIDVDGANGQLDYSEYFGEVKYKNRKLSFEFNTIVEPKHFLTLFSAIQDALHGQRMKIILDADNEYYYIGRLSVSSFANEKNIGIISIECDCEPYKYKQNKTVVTVSVSDCETAILKNARMRVVPLITTTATMRITYENTTYVVDAGTFTLPTLELSQGQNIVEIEGNGQITFTYQEGEL